VDFYRDEKKSRDASWRARFNVGYRKLILIAHRVLKRITDLRYSTRPLKGPFYNNLSLQ
jgi:hypothetical protein